MANTNTNSNICRSVFKSGESTTSKTQFTQKWIEMINRIEKIDETVYTLAGGAGSKRGTGGMKTKLRAAEMAIAQGIDTIITNGKAPEALYEIVKGNSVGTLFAGKTV